jgi:hypothetical protein
VDVLHENKPKWDAVLYLYFFSVVEHSLLVCEKHLSKCRKLIDKIIGNFGLKSVVEHCRRISLKHVRVNYKKNVNREVYSLKYRSQDFEKEIWALLPF